MATHPELTTGTAIERPAALPDRVLGIYADEETAARGVQALLDASFAPERIEVIAASHGEAERVPVEYHSLAPHASLAGAMLGAAAAAIGATLLARGDLTLPGLHLAVGHPLAVALQAGVGGALLGGVAGALIGLYLCRREPDFDETDLRDGTVLVGVPAQDRARRREARRALMRSGALGVRV